MDAVDAWCCPCCLVCVCEWGGVDGAVPSDVFPEAGEEHGHFFTGDGLVGCVGVWGLAGGDSQCVDAFDFGGCPWGEVVEVGERCCAGGAFAAGGPPESGEEGCHFSSGDGVVGCVGIWGFAGGDSQSVDALDFGGCPWGVVEVGERGGAGGAYTEYGSFRFFRFGRVERSGRSSPCGWVRIGLRWWWLWVGLGGLVGAALPGV